MIREGLQNFCKEFLGIYRSSKISHVANKDGIKIVQQFFAAHIRLQTTFLCLADLISEFGVEALPLCLRMLSQIKHHNDFVLFCGHVASPLFHMP